jgi:hypothetical protein
MLFGGTFDHFGSTKHFTLEESVPSTNKDGNNRHHRSYNTQMLFRMAGGGSVGYTEEKKGKTKYITPYVKSWSSTGTGCNGKSWNLETFNASSALRHITEIQYTIYRVNSYDWETGLYTINTNVGANNSERITLNDPYKERSNDGR